MVLRSRNARVLRTPLRPCRPSLRPPRGPDARLPEIVTFRWGNAAARPVIGRLTKTRRRTINAHDHVDASARKQTPPPLCLISRERLWLTGIWEQLGGVVRSAAKKFYASNPAIWFHIQGNETGTIHTSVRFHKIITRKHKMWSFIENKSFFHQAI